MKFLPEHSRELHSLTDRNFLKPQDLKDKVKGLIASVKVLLHVPALL